VVGGGGAATKGVNTAGVEVDRWEPYLPVGLQIPGYGSQGSWKVPECGWWVLIPLL
jgi:hypothetical protein